MGRDMCNDRDTIPVTVFTQPNTVHGTMYPMVINLQVHGIQRKPLGMAAHGVLTTRLM